MKITHKVLLPFLIVLTAAICLFSFAKGELVLILNSYRSLFFDVFFKSLSSIGNSISVFLFLAIVLRYKLKFLCFFILAFFIESTIVILCKQLIFNGAPRPYLFFETKEMLSQINFVDGVKVHKRGSYPSGHTAYAFVIATFFALKIKKILPAVVLCLFATLIGVSRMYLMQHFFADVFTGAVVGIASAYLAIVLVKKSRKRTWYNMKVRFAPRHKNLLALTPENS